MIAIRNIQINEININNNENMKKCIELIEYVHKPAMDLFPDKSEYTVDFELHNATSDLANAIRRCLIEEIEVQALSAETQDIETDDKYILPDVVISYLEAMPINQEVQIDASKLKLEAINNTTEIKTLFSDDITYNTEQSVSSKTKIVDLHEVLLKNLYITKLHPQCYMRIKRMKIIKGKATEDANSFTLLSNIRYKILDVDPEATSSLVSKPTAFKIGYTTSRNISANKPIMLCCDTLISRLEAVAVGLTTNDSSNIQHVEIEPQPNGIVHVHINNEYWTIANLISKYCFMQDENIPFVSPGIVHPSTNKAYVKIKHDDWKNIMSAAIKQAIRDLETIKKAFK